MQSWSLFIIFSHLSESKTHCLKLKTQNDIFCSILCEERVFSLYVINLYLKIIQSYFIFRHCAITKSGWDRHLAYSFKLAKQNNNNNGRTKNSYNNSRHQVFTLTMTIYISYYLTDRTKIYSLRP